jgi:integrase
VVASRSTIFRMGKPTKRGSKKRAAGEGTLRQRPDGIWEWRPPPSFPVRKTLYARRQEDVLKKRDQFLKDFEQGLNLDARKLTVGEYLDLWLEDAVEGSVWYTTYKDHERNVRLHLKPTIGRTLLKDLTRMHVQRLLNAKAKEGYSPRTVRYIHTTLSKALTQAADWDLVPKNVASRAKLPKEKRKKRETLSAENVGAFFSAASEDRFGALYVLAVTSGLRPGELLALKWEDVDLETGALSVRRSVSEDEGGPVIREETKTSAGRRLELLPVAVEALKKHRLRQNEERLRYRRLWRNLGLVFPSTIGTIMRRNNLHRRSYKPLLKKAGLPDIRLYDLRHTFATLMFENKEPLKLVSEMLGHASVRQTADTYTHVSSTMHREAAMRLNDFLSGHLK